MHGLAEATFRPLSRWTAKKKQKDCEEAAKMPGGSSMYRQLAHVYKQLSMGRKVMSVNKAMQVAGVKADGLPVLAIANAAARWVWYEYYGGTILDPGASQWDHAAVSFVSDYGHNPRWNQRSSIRATKLDTFRFTRDFFPVRPQGNTHRARVPVVPPEHLPRAKLRNYQILWEADWESAPRDPVLLRRITRDHFVVMAQWDLTEIERLVLEMAAFEGE